MTRLFTGPIELAEMPSASEGVWVGTKLKFLFQVLERPIIAKDTNSPIFPTLRIKTHGVETWLGWQQHEVKINDFLVGTIHNLSEEEKRDEFIFKFQPKILKIDNAENLWDVAQENVNSLTIELGSGGFGFNDNFVIESIDIDHVQTNFS